MIISNPSIELWFLYHYTNQKAVISTNDCIKELSNRNRNQYKKGVIDKNLREKLDAECKKACERAKTSQLFQNPSSNIYELIEDLESVKK
ncbi:RloB domain-containing protein [Aquiflexum lacus]|uniref:RloB domain-containing protein n=1 Tax=Aquiflexum lacus TaxID=2483805 RepID=UPI0018954F5B|nr:RloB domain-containing protein [Aquiflexum lacus]